ncbi:hypothetical protein BDV33DRAFT_211164 [Aspergillus novoparasiticus]|uniref:Uncharacterized protein n=1 Tax=Aspergillus novoparasiticus TaxID=986946 RepID=A0A5N6E4X8_9EURO|nr:hypothetical protein BDV33DRAFT_211164 [Aspergillus novoparasiticus]
MTLHDHGRALATLKEDDVFLTEAGSVRIAGIENSCAIEKAEMNANTLKKTALAEIVRGLLQNNKSETPWSSNARELPDRLVKQPLAELLHDPIFEELEGSGGLQILVNIVNKTAYHRITVLACPPRE